jgi:hypothetical protein
MNMRPNWEGFWRQLSLVRDFVGAQDVSSVGSKKRKDPLR